MTDNSRVTPDSRAIVVRVRDKIDEQLCQQSKSDRIDVIQTNTAGFYYLVVF